MPQNFLQVLASSAPFIPSDRIAIVVAHPDDETIGVGGSLARLKTPWIVCVTDGAPHSLTDARAHGFSTREDYAQARRRELEAAVACAGLPKERLAFFGITDQDAAYALVRIARRLRDFFEMHQIDLVLTHPYEGGHPDHDSVAFATHAAAPPAIVEMAFYHARGPVDRAEQHFSFDPLRPETTIALDDGAIALKRRMIAAHATQQATLAPFDATTERFRIAPTYDFSALPNGGHLLYERYDWGMTGARWRALAQTALKDLGLGGVR